MKIHRWRKQEKGVALLIALSFLITISFLVLEVSYETILEYSIASRKLHKVQAYYGARSGVDLALLRLKIYQEVRGLINNQDQNVGEGIQNNKEVISMLNQIWSMQLSWPMSDWIPKEVSLSLKNALKAIEKKSFMKVGYSMTILGQSDKIDVNNLGSSIEHLATHTQETLLALFEKEKKENKSFNDKYLDFNFKELLNNIADWVDRDKKSRNGEKSESSFYDFGRDHNDRFIPPNQPFKSLSELHMVAGMKDDFYQLLLPHITLFGEKGFNINWSENINRLFFLDQEEREALLELKEEEEECVKKGEDLKKRFEEVGLDRERVEELVTKIPFSFDCVENHFYILARSEHRNVESQIVVYVQNSKRIFSQLERNVEESEIKWIVETKERSPTSNQDQQNQEESTKNSEKFGTQTIVYWQEI